MVLINKGRGSVGEVRDSLRENDVRRDVKKVLELLFRAQASTFREVAMFSMAQASSGVWGIDEKSRFLVS